MAARRVESKLLQSERQAWRSKYPKFIILRTRLISWLGPIVFFHTTCKKRLTFNFN